MRGLLLMLLGLFAVDSLLAQAGTVRVAAVRYGGGGDWYQAQTPLPPFLAFVRQNTLIDIDPQPYVVDLHSDALFAFPFLVLSGHGNVEFTEPEVERLRRYLTSGGFLFIDDDYGLDPAIRREMAKVFPEQEFIPIPHAHPIYRSHFVLEQGPPKIHEHDGLPAQGYGLFHDGRLVVYYLHESNITDGWEPPEVHGNPPDIRQAALQLGVNILVYALR